MVRTQIQLTEEQSAELKRIAIERGVSVAEVVRDGIARIIKESRGVNRHEKRRRALAAVGQFKGPSDLSQRHDDYFVESIIDTVAE